jgi:hypothetical protein
MVRFAIWIIMETTSFHQKWIFILSLRRKPSSLGPQVWGPIYGLWRTVLSHTTIFLKQSLMIVNGTKDPMDRWTLFLETPAKAGIKTKSQTMVSQTRPPVRRFSELRN